MWVSVYFEGKELRGWRCKVGQAGREQLPGFTLPSPLPVLTHKAFPVPDSLKNILLLFHNYIKNKLNENILWIHGYI